MLTQTQLTQIKEHLEKAQNPLFFFDNDADGLCSFLILQRAIGRGKGVVIRRLPALDKTYFRKVEELNPDYVFILDKPVVSDDFIDAVCQKNLPIVWIDHHNVQIKKSTLDKTHYFNPKESEPVTYIAQKVFNRKQDLWLAMTGCVGDVYMPEFAKQFSKQFPELFNTKLPAFDSMYTTEIGKLVQILNFALKDTTTNVVKLMKFLIQAKSPYDILHETPQNKQIHAKYNQLKKIYNKILDKAESNINPKSPLIFFTYSGEVAMSSEIANALICKHKEKTVVVAYKKDGKVNLSIRGDRAREITLQAIKNIENSRGGGHEKTTGAQVPEDKLEEFMKKIQRLLNQKE